jgi:hypothetical protein
MGSSPKERGEEKRRWVAAKIKMQEETKLDYQRERDPILDKKMANRYLVACTYGYIVYSIYLRRGRAAAGGGGRGGGGGG